MVLQQVAIVFLLAFSCISSNPPLSLLRESMFVSNYVLAVLPCLASTGPQLSLDPLKAWHLQKYRRDISEVGIISHTF
jgi:hypothetical protein